jgi:hypothetical protein
MAEYERRLTNIETDLKGITRELHLHRWILGYLVAATTAILLRVFS